MLKSLKNLCFDSLREGLSKIFSSFRDSRDPQQVSYTLHDIVMSGFACMYFQSPSLLEFQRTFKRESHASNLESLFKVEKIPEDTQLRGVLDRIDPSSFREVFSEFFLRLQRGKHLEQYQFTPGKYLCSIDGTQFTCSPKINCERCLTAEHENGAVTYSHKSLQAAVMHPGIKQVIPLMAEEIANSDGQTKQDCEINAAKRALQKMRQDHPQLGLIILGDGLFSKQPFIEELKARRMDYILVAKPADHKTMMEWVERSAKVQERRRIVSKNKILLYEWLEKVPLNGRDDALSVNFFSCKTIAVDDQGKETIKSTNSWVTNLSIDANNIDDLERAGRCRWKIENECFNTLKNYGYHLEHNYGHGKEHLCFNFYLLTLIAFLMHQIFELSDELFQQCRKKLGSKQTFWQTMRMFMDYMLFDSWRTMLQFAIDPKPFGVLHMHEMPP